MKKEDMIKLIEENEQKLEKLDESIKELKQIYWLVSNRLKETEDASKDVRITILDQWQRIIMLSGECQRMKKELETSTAELKLAVVLGGF